MYANVPEKYRSEQAFIREIWFDPTELSSRLIYADWLEEHQDVRARLLHNDVQVVQWAEMASAQTREGEESLEQLQLARQRLLRQVDKIWVSLIGRGEIEACPNTSEYRYNILDLEGTADTEKAIEFQYRCPKRWENLQPSDDATDARLCAQCQRLVYYCFDLTTARAHARQGHCIALDASVKRFPGDMRHAALDLDLGPFLGMPFHD